MNIIFYNDMLKNRNWDVDLATWTQKTSDTVDTPLQTIIDQPPPAYKDFAKYPLATEMEDKPSMMQTTRVASTILRDTTTIESVSNPQANTAVSHERTEDSQQRGTLETTVTAVQTNAPCSSPTEAPNYPSSPVRPNNDRNTPFVRTVQLPRQSYRTPARVNLSHSGFTTAFREMRIKLLLSENAMCYKKNWMRSLSDGDRSVEITPTETGWYTGMVHLTSDLFAFFPGGHCKRRQDHSRLVLSERPCRPKQYGYVKRLYDELKNRVAWLIQRKVTINMHENGLDPQQCSYVEDLFDHPWATTKGLADIAHNPE
ncbi:hypothetical protein CLF_105029 [Clonorchis sinensis]|uniref:Uncharacterized protein n=1 Tax=Clonorchis sinensis TaxID=79923 RepID=G7YCU1_CLOSI|nr:hypothetical protein CLF_105029 [Clonorchis sinensis]